jgi:hypothetical protein
MAGSFGFNPAHYDVSMTIGEKILLPAVRATSADTLLIANGFSCREQITQATGRPTLHIAEVLDRARAEKCRQAQNPECGRKIDEVPAAA